MHNTIGHNFRLSIYGGSHTETLGLRIEGVPKGITLCADDFEEDLSRRRSGGLGTTSRHESDIPELRSGTTGGKTDGTTLEIEFRNSDTRSKDYSRFASVPRPSHADLTAREKYGPDFDLRGGGIFSGRMTVLLVAAGVVAKKILGNVEFDTRLIEVGGQRDVSAFDSIIRSAAEQGDSVGGVVECRVKGDVKGLGEPFFDSVESVASHLLFSVPAVKGVEFGSGFEGVRLRGSQRNDCIVDAAGRTGSNNEGGINGGIANGNEIVVRVAVKPTPSIFLPQQTFDFSAGGMSTLRINGRHDACIARRAMVVIESVMAIALAELAMER